MANVNLSTLTKHPAKQTFVVLVLHYLGPTTSVDNMGDHNTYEQLFIVLPVSVITEIFEKTTGKVVFYLFCSLVMDNLQGENWIVKLRYRGKDTILDDYLIDSFWQIEI